MRCGPTLTRANTYTLEVSAHKPKMESGLRDFGIDRDARRGVGSEAFRTGREPREHVKSRPSCSLDFQIVLEPCLMEYGSKAGPINYCT